MVPMPTSSLSMTSLPPAQLRVAPPLPSRLSIRGNLLERHLGNRLVSSTSSSSAGSTVATPPQDAAMPEMRRSLRRRCERPVVVELCERSRAVVGFRRASSMDGAKGVDAEDLEQAPMNVPVLGDRCGSRSSSNSSSDCGNEFAVLSERYRSELRTAFQLLRPATSVVRDSRRFNVEIPCEVLYVWEWATLLRKAHKTM
eukprot:gnl/TRDRNA2_/TRDRNA2_169716_c0_seq5.p1 gnl/TRDRNA2_/TRDRNA2_169716_c0~~gnl/TRDRNA2_/TRDRNA2_169716_c0_seq5.p1  ORF type:complete len:199 (-),score=22.61 gnl/TRDRNA2_/TRDRNA2_169716_c0_seq5:182-778(-)